MERIAVTGANGFVGRHVVARAAAAGHEVMGVVRSEAAARVVREAGGHPVELVGRDPEALAVLLEGADAVVSALGPTSREGDLHTRTAEALVEAMGSGPIRVIVPAPGEPLSF